MLYEASSFDMTTVSRPVHFWQGTDDKLVPEPSNRMVAERTPGAIWHLISGGGHVIALIQQDAILTRVASDLAAVPT
ncbi:alpha/beta hydrolase [Synechococcus sp. CCY 0621]|uniref:alpha/beta fold hydrolase n=1 Tax=Synechococcus sp. CCY 0621 TaxID=2815603 RepID=UPI001C24E6A4|nr:alpha/beta hydrolase [Synechococcus sp. CCY 0621]